MSTVLRPGPLKRATWHDAFDTQMGLWRWVRTTPGLEWLHESFRINTEPMDRDGRELTAKIYAAEESKLLGSDPIFVSAEMCEVVDAAYKSFDPEPLYPTDLVAALGFMFFERPFDVLDRFDTPMRIAAVSWAPIVASKAEAIELALSEDTLAALQARDYQDAWKHVDDAPERPIDGIAMTIYSVTRDETREQHPEWNLPAIVPMHFTPWWFGMTFDGNEVDLQGKPTGAGWWWRIAQTSFRLMMQQIAVRHQERPDRGARRDAARRGFAARDVVVVRLRREKGQPNEGMGADANYSHRFIVSGHWRNQWYPSSHVHRQIWISPYVKGPEDAPLVVRPRRVFTWNR